MIDKQNFKLCETRYGQLWVPSTNDLISGFLLEYGEWADLELRFIADNIADNSSILDIGAFLGTFGIGLSQIKKLESVSFFEANDKIIPALTANVSMNCK